ncbi:hypothetical protein BDQ17DRAFT_1423942 [Cyathus striatus]|nr:hypothetical protein BDQ17DRAFT_1423942 [Cyathus striatus]
MAPITIVSCSMNACINEEMMMSMLCDDVPAVSNPSTRCIVPNFLDVNLHPDLQAHLGTIRGHQEWQISENRESFDTLLAELAQYAHPSDDPVKRASDFLSWLPTEPEPEFPLNDNREALSHSFAPVVPLVPQHTSPAKEGRMTTPKRGGLTTPLIDFTALASKYEQWSQKKECSPHRFSLNAPAKKYTYNSNSLDTTTMPSFSGLKLAPPPKTTPRWFADHETPPHRASVPTHWPPVRPLPVDTQSEYAPTPNIDPVNLECSIRSPEAQSLQWDVIPCVSPTPNATMLQRPIRPLPARARKKISQLPPTPPTTPSELCSPSPIHSAQLLLTPASITALSVRPMCPLPSRAKKNSIPTNTLSAPVPIETINQDINLVKFRF